MLGAQAVWSANTLPMPPRLSCTYGVLVLKYASYSAISGLSASNSVPSPSVP